MTEANEAGLLIQRARQRKRWTQQQLADALGVSRHAVIYWETGRHFPQRRTAAIEDLLGITLPRQEAA